MEQVLNVKKQATPFAFKTGTRPYRLEADQEAHVFRRLAPGETPPSIDQLRQPAPLIVVVTSGVLDPALQQMGDILGRALGRDEVVFRLEKDLKNEALPLDDIVVIGPPRHPQLKKTIQKDLRLGSNRFQLDGSTYSDDETSFFGVWRHPKSSRHTLGLWLPARNVDPQTIARKIPHYGRYSYIAFQAAQNIAKEVWPPASSPLVYRWPNGE